MNTHERLAAVIETCESTLDSIFNRFSMHGDPRMVETAFLSYLEILLIAQGKLHAGTSIYVKWVEFCSKQFGVLDPRMLADRLEWQDHEKDEATMIDVMRAFRERLLHE